MIKPLVKITSLRCRYFHGLSALSHATDDQFELTKKQVEISSRSYEEWKGRSIASLRTICDAVSVSIDELTHRWIFGTFNAVLFDPL